MYIKTLTITNFREIETATLHDLAESVVLFGPNGAGKTTFKYALQMLLFGFCAETDKRGAGSENMVRDGAKRAEISADIVFPDPAGDTVIALTMTIPRKGSKTFELMDRSTGELPEGMQSREAFWSAYAGVDMRHAMVAAMPAEMLSSKTMSDILTDYVSSDFSREQLKELCLHRWAEVQAFCEEHSLAMATVDDLTAIGATAYKQRTAVNGAKDEAEQEAGIAQCEQPKKDGAPIAPETAAKYPAAIEALRKQRDGLIADRARAETAPTAEQIAEVTTRLTDARDAAALALSEATTVTAAAKEAADAAANAINTINAEHSASSLAWSKAADHAKVVGDAVESLKRSAPCAACGQEMPEDLRASLLATAETTLEAAQGAHSAAKEKSEALLAELTAARAAAKERTQEHEAAIAARNAAQTALTVAQNALDAAPQPWTGPTLEEIDAQIAAIDVRIAAGEATLKQIEQWNRYQGALARVKANEKKADALTFLVKAFKEGEITKKMIGGGLRAFTDRVNAVLSPLGFTLGTARDGKNIELLVKLPKAQAARPVSACSSGERLIVSFGVAVAFADTGAPVFIDDLNLLDFGNFGALLGLLKARRMGTVIGFSTITSRSIDLQRIGAAMAPVSVYRVEGGVFTPQGVDATTAEEIAA